MSAYVKHTQNLAQILAWAIPACLLGGAFLSQYGFGLYPCEMCWWQRYPHFIALLFALLSYVLPRPKIWIALAALALLSSGLIGAFHAGVEYDWWAGITDCAATVSTDGDALEAVFNAPLVRCDKAPWDLFGISLAGWNFLISTFSAIAIFVLLGRKERV